MKRTAKRFSSRSGGNVQGLGLALSNCRCSWESTTLISRRRNGSVRRRKSGAGRIVERVIACSQVGMQAKSEVLCHYTRSNGFPWTPQDVDVCIRRRKLPFARTVRPRQIFCLHQGTVVSWKSIGFCLAVVSAQERSTPVDTGSHIRRTSTFERYSGLILVVWIQRPRS